MERRLQPQAGAHRALRRRGGRHGGLARALTPSLIDATIDYIESTPVPVGFAFIGFQPLGAAANRVAPNATAFWNRHARYDMVAGSFWKVPGEGAERNTEWTRAAWAKLEPFTEGYYVNLGESQQDVHAHRVRTAYGDNYVRLLALKKRYDPANLFRLNANIKPA